MDVKEDYERLIDVLLEHNIAFDEDKRNKTVRHVELDGSERTVQLDVRKITAVINGTKIAINIEFGEKGEIYGYRDDETLRNSIFFMGVQEIIDLIE